MLLYSWSNNHHINCQFFQLHEGCVPSAFANAIVHPPLKKPSLDPDDLSNYRPISTLNFVSKILERIVMNRMQTHLSSNSLISPFHSAYRKFHSTETALLAVHNDIICSMDQVDMGKVTALGLLDLSAAFDTVECGSFSSSSSSQELVWDLWSCTKLV